MSGKSFYVSEVNLRAAIADELDQMGPECSGDVALITEQQYLVRVDNGHGPSGECLYRVSPVGGGRPMSERWFTEAAEYFEPEEVFDVAFTQTHGEPCSVEDEAWQIIVPHAGMIGALRRGMDDMAPETLKEFAGHFYSADACVAVTPGMCEFIFEITSGPDPIDVEALEERMENLAEKGRLLPESALDVPKRKGMAFS